LAEIIHKSLIGTRKLFIKTGNRFELKPLPIQLCSYVCIREYASTLFIRLINHFPLVQYETKIQIYQLGYTDKKNDMLLLTNHFLLFFSCERYRKLILSKLCVQRQRTPKCGKFPVTAISFEGRAIISDMIFIASS